MNGRGLVAALAVLCTALAGAGCGDEPAGDSTRAGGGAGGEGEGRLLGGECPGYLSLKKEPRPRQIAAAARGEFQIFGRSLELEPPVDWDQDPYGSEPWRKNLHKFAWMAPLLEGYREDGNVAAIRRAKELVLDWAREFPRGPEPDLLWERKLASDRMGVIGFVLLAADCEDELTPQEGEALLGSIRAHVAFIEEVLARDDEPSNHTLLAYSGLVVAARQLGFLGAEAERWRERGLAGFEEELTQLVDTESGVHLEHSPTYQAKTVGHVERFLETAEGEPESLAALARRMRRVSAWFAMPDGNVVPFGDTPYERRSPPYAVKRADEAEGLAPTLEAGYGIVREGGSYLGTAAGFHTDAHKQPDELTFNLFEDGRRVIVDSGRPNKSQDPDDPESQEVLDYALSARAHSTLTVDGESFPLDGEPYGSGLYAQGHGDGWYAIEGKNHLLEGEDVEHRRLFLYRPGEVLVIVDRVHSADRHTYERHLQVAPGLEARPRGNAVALSGSGFEGAIWDAPQRGSEPPRLYEGDSGLRGFYIPVGFGPPKPRPLVDLVTRRRSANLVTTIAIGTRQPVTAELAGPRAVRIDDSRRGPVTVRAERARPSARFEVSAEAG